MPDPVNPPNAACADVPPLRQSRWSLLILLVVIGAAITAAALSYHQFLQVHRQLWNNADHDRNAHYLYGLKLAVDVKRWDVYHLVQDLNGARVWPPLHGMVLAAVLLVGGFDYRLGVLPSLAGLVGTAVFGFLVARRSVPRGGNLAGLVAALFILASPAHRAFSTDIMLESLGACLSLMVLYFYLTAVQENTAWAGRCLALTLTALFYHKYNYWLLVALALGAAEGLARGRLYWQIVLDELKGADWRAWLLDQTWRPLNYLLAALVVLLGFVFLWGDRPLPGLEVSVYPPYNLLHVAYGVLLLRLAPWWWRRGRVWCRQLDPRYRQLLAWHAAPVLLGFLLPKHLGYFLWYLSPANRDPAQTLSLVGKATSYGRMVVADYHLGPESALLAVGLIAVALFACRRLRPGGQAVLCFFLVAALLTIPHPNHKSRLVHSWIAAGWVMAGIGLATMVYGRFLSGRPRVRFGLIVTALAGMGWLHAPGLLQPGRSSDGGPASQGLSLLDVSDSYLPAIASSPRPALLAAIPFRFVGEWTFLEHADSRRRLETHWFGFADEQRDNRQGFTDWLRRTECDTLVFVDRLPGSPGDEAFDYETAARDGFRPECENHGPLRELLDAQTAFRLVEHKDFPEHGCTMSIWRRSPAAPLPPLEQASASSR